ncbi:hybrid sensor histidine kinase/response regulator [Falsiroseomonas selenitidurans]|uniref:histidine kinase n=1 Tax=Falsiroseomonas selenitidurans TaxID=2716335 RepID=A0ABX1DZ51_9PROT|nr:hybrid sensor histidine kinase/response regulator [Falsiroseomonas selenitidurans]NKC30106.1 response regulator [Falsiroseomonas selenitidurans]
MLLLVALCILIPVATLAVNGMERHARVLYDARRDGESIAAVLHQMVRNLLETQDLVLDMVEDMISDMTPEEVASPATSRRLATIVNRLEQTVSVWVSDADGTFQAASRPWPRGLGVRGREHFEIQRNAPVPRHVSEPYVGRTSGRAAFAMSRRRSAADGSFQGAIHVAVNLDYVARSFATAIGTHGGAAAMFRNDGTLLARVPPVPPDFLADPRQVPRLSENNPLLRAFREKPDAGVIEAASPMDGQNRVYAYRAVAPFPVVVGYGVDLPDRLAAWQRDMARRAALVLLVVLLLLGATLVAWRGMAGRAEATAALKQEAERRHVAEARLLRARALEAMGRMARGVAHDLNNLLTVVLGNLETLEESATEPAQRGLAERTRRAAEASARLAASLLAYARTQVLRVERVSVASLLRELHPVLQDLAGPGVILRQELEPGLPDCEADPAQLGAALSNLVANARDALAGRPSPGHITITARRARLEGKAFASGSSHATVAMPQGRFIAIAVTDDGAGMAAKVAAHVFEPFFTTKAPGTGTGLGLSQVYGLVTQLGGQVTLRSEPERGTTITLFLPEAGQATAPMLGAALSPGPIGATGTARDPARPGPGAGPAPAAMPGAPPGPAPASAPQPAPQSAPQSAPGSATRAAPEPAPDVAPTPAPAARPARILVVEDQPEIRAMTERMLARGGHAVTSVSGGKAAVAMLAQGEPFDLVLSDVLMPGGMDGMELARHIRAHHPEVSVVLMSGYTPDPEQLGRVTAEAAADADSPGMPHVTGFLGKPFTRQALEEAVRRALG